VRNKWIAEAQFIRDIFDGATGVLEQFGGAAQAQMLKVAVGALASKPLKRRHR